MATELVDELGARIANREIAAGSTFTIADICDKYGLSRTVAREAMRVLEDKGMLVPKRRVGLQVTPISEWTPFDPAIIRWRLAGRARKEELQALGELCTALAPWACWYSANRASEADRELMLAYAQRMVTLLGEERFASFVDLEISFQCVLYRSANNRLFDGIANLIGDVIRTMYGQRPERLLGDDSVGHSYCELAEAIRCGDAEAARNAMMAILAHLGFDSFQGFSLEPLISRS